MFKVDFEYILFRSDFDRDLSNKHSYVRIQGASAPSLSIFNSID
jgi:hypothetical protein